MDQKGDKNKYETNGNFDFIKINFPRPFFKTKRPGHDIVGRVHVKQIYEIAKVKQADEHLKHLSLESLSRSIMGSCLSIGLQVLAGDEQGLALAAKEKEGKAAATDKNKKKISVDDDDDEKEEEVKK